MRSSALVSRFRLVRGYPLPDDNDNIAARHELLDLLTRESLDAAIADPGTFDMACSTGSRTLMVPATGTPAISDG